MSLKFNEFYLRIQIWTKFRQLLVYFFSINLTKDRQIVYAFVMLLMGTPTKPYEPSEVLV